MGNGCCCHTAQGRGVQVGFDRCLRGAVPGASRFQAGPASAQLRRRGHQRHLWFPQGAIPTNAPSPATLRPRFPVQVSMRRLPQARPARSFVRCNCQSGEAVAAPAAVSLCCARCRHWWSFRAWAAQDLALSCRAGCNCCRWPDTLPVLSISGAQAPPCRHSPGWRPCRVAGRQR